jgi:hypothetical protein
MKIKLFETLKELFHVASEDEIKELYPRWLKARELGPNYKSVFESCLPISTCMKLHEYHNYLVDKKCFEEMKEKGIWK